MVNSSIGASVVMEGGGDGMMLAIYLMTTLRGHDLGNPCHQEQHEPDQ
jgi:hypothetical protein